MRLTKTLVRRLMNWMKFKMNVTSTTQEILTVTTITVRMVKVSGVVTTVVEIMVDLDFVHEVITIRMPVVSRMLTVKMLGPKMEFTLLTVKIRKVVIRKEVIRKVVFRNTVRIRKEVIREEKEKIISIGIRMLIG